MEFCNMTPFPCLAFEAIDQHDQQFHVVVMRATFDIVPNEELKLAEEQQPLALSDDYFGEINRSSVMQESDLSPYKPKCDVIVIGSAYAPSGKPAPRFEAGIRITGSVTLDKKLTINGPRFWEKRGSGWTLTEPTSIDSLPLQYEYAYGGECRINKEDSAAKQVEDKFHLTPDQRQQHPEGPELAPVAHTACEQNPVGIGFAEPWYLEAIQPDRIPAPQIESSIDPIQEFGKQYGPQGLGTITKSWNQRLKLAGTYDEAWLKDKWPGLPNDLDFAYWNCAHPDMQVPYLKGDELFELGNLTPQGSLKFQLSGQLISIAAAYEGGEEELIPARFDTVIIEPDSLKVSLVWRAVVPVSTELLSLETRMILEEDKIKQDNIWEKMSLPDNSKFKPGKQND